MNSGKKKRDNKKIKNNVKECNIFGSLMSIRKKIIKKKHSELIKYSNASKLKFV